MCHKVQYSNMQLMGCFLQTIKILCSCQHYQYNPALQSWNIYIFFYKFFIMFMSGVILLFVLFIFNLIISFQNKNKNTCQVRLFCTMIFSTSHVCILSLWVCPNSSSLSRTFEKLLPFLHTIKILKPYQQHFGIYLFIVRRTHISLKIFIIYDRCMIFFLICLISIKPWV